MALEDLHATTAPVHPDPLLEERLSALGDYDILDTEAERDFDDIAFIAQHICKTPAALISLVEKDRQWFKSHLGFEACETSIDRSVCRHGLAARDLLIINDLTLDERTRDNPLVVGEPGIRFYAGAPLVTPGGVAIGMLCVIDTVARPHGLDEAEKRTLWALANQVIAQLEMRKTLREQQARLAAERDEAAILRRAMDRLQLAEEAAGIGAYEANFATRTLTVSREFCRLHGIEFSQTIAIDDMCQRVPGASEIDSLLTESEDFSRGEFRIERASDGAERWLDVRARALTDADGSRIGVTGVVSDVTDQRTINDEISHRMKNTMALVQAIAGHTLRGMPDPEPLREFNRRVTALSTAHDILLSRAIAAACLHEVASGVLARLSVDDRVKISGRDVELSSRAVLVCSMVLHELGTNAMKYGALSVQGGTVELHTTIEARDDGDWLVIDWQERGGPPIEKPAKLGLGTRLIQRGLAPDSETDLRYEVQGFSAVIRSPLDQIST